MNYCKHIYKFRAEPTDSSNLDYFLECRMCGQTKSEPQGIKRKAAQRFIEEYGVGQ